MAFGAGYFGQTYFGEYAPAISPFGQIMLVGGIAARAAADRYFRKSSKLTIMQLGLIYFAKVLPAPVIVRQSVVTANYF